MTALPPGRMAYDKIPTFWRASFDHQIDRWEGLYQADPDDSGNWTSDGRNLGTMRGVTPGALAEFMNVPQAKLMVEDMMAITHEMAVQIGYWGYVRRPRFDRLPMNRFTEFYVDWGWASGPFTAVRAMQRLIATTPDGKIGDLTLQAYIRFTAWARYIHQDQPFDGLEAAIHHAVDARIANLRAIVARRPVTAKYLKGWTRRAEAFRPLVDETLRVDPPKIPGPWWKPGALPEPGERDEEIEKLVA